MFLNLNSHILHIISIYSRLTAGAMASILQETEVTSPRQGPTLLILSSATRGPWVPSMTADCSARGPPVGAGGGRAFLCRHSLLCAVFPAVAPVGGLPRGSSFHSTGVTVLPPHGSRSAAGQRACCVPLCPSAAPAGPSDTVLQGSLSLSPLD